MASGEAGLEHGTGAFRRLLGEAGASEQTRVDALVAFSQRSVLAATWPGQNQAIRTLTNREGETAMPLFTGMDVLDETATRFGWRNPDGSLPMRELPAREALRHALARGVHFVVVDIGCDHSVEFARAEIEPLLNLQTQGAFAGAGEAQAAILDAVRRSSRPPAGVAADGSRMPGAARTPEIDAPFAELKGGMPVPTRPASQPLPGHRPSPRPRPVSQPLDPTTLRKAASGRAASQPLAGARPGSQQNMPAVRPVSQPLGSGRPGSSQQMPATRPLSQPLMPAVRPGSQQNIGAIVPPSAAAQAARAKLTSSLADARPPSVMPPSMEGAAHEAANDAAVAQDAEQAERESGEQTRELSEGSLPDALLQAVSSGLRSFPEVEWACVLTDGSELPVIGVRVDPSFLNRVAQITDVIIDTGEKTGQEVQVLLLNTPDLVKNAHRQGKAFYPWKR